MQFHYVTANSCHPEGYLENSFLRDNNWLRSGGGLSDCQLPYDPTGARTTTSPEQFWVSLSDFLIFEGLPCDK